jgi:hypothetical protein
MSNITGATTSSPSFGKREPTQTAEAPYNFLIYVGVGAAVLIIIVVTLIVALIALKRRRVIRVTPELPLDETGHQPPKKPVLSGKSWMDAPPTLQRRGSVSLPPLKPMKGVHK